MLVLIVSLTIHELAHAKAAEMAGDDTARLAGRISLNPLSHLDPFGTVMMIVSSISHFGIGWAKPVPVNPMKFRHPRWDNLKVSLWGPLSNLLIALVAAQVIRFGGDKLEYNDLMIAGTFVMINLSLAVFNMIPIPPLDGSHILSSLLPIEKAQRYDRFMGSYGMILFLVMILSPQIGGFDPLHWLIGVPRDFLFHIMTGLPY